MASIIDRSGEKRLSLVGEQAARTISIGSTWTHLRVALFFSVDAASTYTVPSFYFGLSSGTASIPGDITVDHFLGFSLVPNLAFSGATTNSYRSAGITTNLGRLSKIEAGSETTSQVGASSTIVYFPKATTVTKIILLDITKGGSWAVQAQHRSSDTVDFPPSSVDAIMATGAFATPVSYFNTTIAVDEATYGDLDTIAISWGHATIPLEISGIAYSRVA